MPAKPDVDTRLLVDVGVGVGVVELVVSSELVDRSVVVLVVTGALELGVVGTVVVVDAVVVTVVCVTGVCVTGVCVTGVSGILVLESEELVEPAALDCKPGTVTCAWAAVGPSDALVAALLPAADDATGPDWATALPQAANKRAVMPWPAAMSAVRRLRWEDISPH